jgi:hypothetical protein
MQRLAKWPGPEVGNATMSGERGLDELAAAVRAPTYSACEPQTLPNPTNLSRTTGAVEIALVESRFGWLRA